MNDNSVNANKQIKFLLKTIREIPTIPSVAVKVLESTASDDIDITYLANIIESDPALSLKILKQANRSGNPLSQQINSIQHSITYLGMNTIRCILLGILSQDYLGSQNLDLLEWKRQIWAHSLACAVAAQLIAETTYPDLKDEAFTAGILHDIGKIVIMTALPGKYKDILQEDASQGVMYQEMEQDIFHCDHTLAGKWLGQKWSLPDYLLNTISYHHQPVEYLDSLRDNKYLVLILKLANNLAHEYFLDLKWNNQFIQEYKYLTRELEIDQETLDNIRHKIPTLYSQRAYYFELENDLYKIQTPLIQKANQKLSSISVQLENKKQKLQENNKLLFFINDLAMNLSNSGSFDDVFYNTANTFLEFHKFYAGVIYIVDIENRMLEGRTWIQNQRSKKLNCFLDNEGLPIWDQQTENFPTGLKEILSSYKSRLEFQTPQPDLFNDNIYFRHPFYIIPLISNSHNIRGEFCFALNKKALNISSEERQGLKQTSNLIISTFEKLKLQENLEVKNEELSLTLNKNQQLSQELIQTERLAAVGQLAAGAAHEINNPLAIINARAQLIHSKEKDENKKQQLNQITGQIERISEILSNLMDFARPSPPQFTKADITSIIDKVLNFVQPKLDKFAIQTHKEYHPDTPMIQADINQLEQAFLNFIINAQHSMEEQGGTLQIRVSPFRRKKYLKITIEDTGIGIPPKNLNKIFNPFYTTKQPGKGTGLGLSTSLSIIENHYGKLDIDSLENHGTSVTIQLPIDLEELRPTKERISLPKQNQSQKSQILIVDDEKHIREILHETLANESMEITTCESADLALNYLDEQNFDLMLLDLRMPVLDGLSMINEIKEKEIDLPIIVITGLATFEEMEEALGKGVYKCIKKPFHIKHLVKDIYDVLSNN